MTGIFRRVYQIQIFSLVAAVLVSALVLGPIRLAVKRFAESVKNDIMVKLEEDLGLELRYQSMSPAPFASLTIRNLDAKFAQGSFTAAKLRVYYNIFIFFDKDRDKDDPLSIIRQISLSDGNLQLDLKTTNNSKPKSIGMSIDPWSLLSNKTVVLNDFIVDLDIGDDMLNRVELKKLEARYNGDIIRYDFVGDGSFDSPAFQDRLGTVAVSVKSNGSFDPRQALMNGRVYLDSAVSGVVALKPISAGFTASRENLTIRRVDDERPLDLSFNRGPDGWILNGEIVDLVLGDLIESPPGSVLAPSFLSSVLDGEFSITSGTDDQQAVYDIDLGFDTDAFNMKLLASGDTKRARIDNFTAENEWGRVTYTGDLLLSEIAPTGVLELELAEDRLGYPVNAVFDFMYKNDVVLATPTTLEAGDLKFDDFQLLLVNKEKSSVVSLYVVPEEPGSESKKAVYVDVLVDYAEDLDVRGFVHIENIGGKTLGRLASLPSPLNFFSNSLVSLDAGFSMVSDGWSFDLDKAKIVDSRNEENFVELRGRANPRVWSLDSLRTDWNGFALSGYLYARQTGGRGIVDGQLGYADNLLPVSGSWSKNDKVLFMLGNVIAVSIGAPAPAGRSLRVSVDGFEIPLGNGVFQADILSSGRLRPDDWQMLVSNARLALVDRIGTDDASLFFNGRVSSDLIELPSIRYDDGFSPLTGSAVGFFPPPTYNDNAQFRVILSNDNGESYNLSAKSSGGEVDVYASIVNGNLARVVPERIAGTVNLRADLSGSIDDPQFTVSLNSKDGRLDGEPFSFNAKALMSDGVMLVQDAEFDSEALSLNRGILILDTKNGTLRSTAALKGMVDQTPVSSGFSAAVDFEEPVKISRIAEIAGENFSGTLAILPILRGGDEHAPALTLQFFRNQEMLYIEAPRDDSLLVSYRFSDGLLNVRSRDPMPIVVTGGGIAKDGRLDLSFPDLSIDPVLINYFIPSDPILKRSYVVFQGGRFIGNLKIKGPASNPSMAGLLRVRDLKVDTPYTYAKIEPANTDIRFEGNRVTIDRIDIPTGDGIVYGGGFFELEGWKLTEFDMTYGARAGPDGDFPPIYYPLLGVDLDGTFMGETHMTGDGERFYLNGDFRFPTLKASLGSKPDIPPPRKRNRPLIPVFLDFNFITGNNCVFYLPNEQVQIVRATAESDQTVNLTYSNVPESLSITGSLHIGRGSILYFDRNFQVTDGFLRFNEDLTNFNPILNFRAETRFKDDEGEEVTVALVYNAPVQSDFNPRVETLPTRSEAGIYALFGQGAIPYAGSTVNEASSILLATGGILAEAGLVRPFEQAIRKTLDLDIVNIQTDIIENALSEGLIRDSGSPLNSTSIGRYLDNTSFFAGKYIGNAVFASGSVKANYFEARQNASILSGLEFDFSIGLEIQTPFFNIAWSYSPSTLDSSSFVADQEISLRWQYTY